MCIRDRDGNFAVGDYFKVEQATGKATLNANAFNLSGLDQLQLGAIGATLGAMIDEFSIDGTLSQNSDAKVPTQKAVKTYVDANTAASPLAIAGGTGSGTVTPGSQTLTVGGTANEIETSAANQGITVGLPNDVTIGNDLTVTNTLSVGGNLTLTGNLTVNGTTTTVATTNTTVADQLFELGNGRTGSATGDSGIVIERGNDTNLFIGWDESSDRFRFCTTAATGATTGDIGDLADCPIQCSQVETSRLVTNEVFEKFNHQSGGGIGGNVDIYLGTHAVHYFSTNSTSNFGFYVRAASGVTLDSQVGNNMSVTFTALINHGGSAHEINAFEIDGVNKFSSIHWAGGSAPSSDAKANGTSVYTFSLLKTATDTWKILGSFTAYED